MINLRISSTTMLTMENGMAQNHHKSLEFDGSELVIQYTINTSDNLLQREETDSVVQTGAVAEEHG